MGYRYPYDPRPKWEWCPKCEAWYELYRREFEIGAISHMPGDCYHGETERKLSDEEMRLASQPAAAIAEAFRLAQEYA